MLKVYDIKLYFARNKCSVLVRKATHVKHSAYYKERSEIHASDFKATFAKFL